MELFPKEIKDGIVKPCDKITYASCALLDSPHDLKITPDISGLEVAKAENDQIDLYYIKAVLASIGWNGNDDVFSRADTWSAKETPKNKQFNLMHQDKVIGHITGNYVVNNNFELIESETTPEEDFHIITTAVIYKYWKDPAFTEEIAKIMGEIEKGEWYISMECLLPSFDYAFKFSDGTEQVVARSADTSYLSKHLRVYGGSGFYGEAKIGRMIRNFVFSGQGLVKNPANKNSVILADLSPFRCTSVLQIPITMGTEISMPTENKEDLETQVAELQTQNKELKAVALQVETLTQAISEKDVKIAELVQASETSSMALTEANAKLAEAITRAEAAERENDKLKGEMKKNAKMSKAKASGVFSDEELVKIEAQLDSLDDTQLDLMIDIAKTRKPVEAKAEEVSENAEEDVQEAKAEEQEKNLDKVEQTKEMSLAGEDSTGSQLETVRASLSEFLNQKYLTKSKKNKGGK